MNHSTNTPPKCKALCNLRLQFFFNKNEKKNWIKSYTNTHTSNKSQDRTVHCSSGRAVLMCNFKEKYLGSGQNTSCPLLSNVEVILLKPRDILHCLHVPFTEYTKVWKHILNVIQAFVSRLSPLKQIFKTAYNILRIQKEEKKRDTTNPKQPKWIRKANIKSWDNTNYNGGMQIKNVKK